MFTDAITSIKAYLYDRAVSPLMGSFIVSWVIWNFQFLLVLIAPISVYEKLWMFENAFFQTNLDVFGNALIFPILTSLGYIFLYPIPSKLVYKFWLNQQNYLKNMKSELELGRVLTVEQSRIILSRLNNEPRELQSENLSLKTENDRIKNENIVLIEKYEEQKSQKESLVERFSDISKLHTILSNSIDTHTNELFLDYVIELLNESQIKILKELSKFNKKDTNEFFSNLDLSDSRTEARKLSFLGLCVIDEAPLFGEICITQFGKTVLARINQIGFAK